MKNVKRILTGILRLSLVLMTAYLFYQGDLLFAFSALIAVLISLLPGIISRNYNISIPQIIEFLMVIVLFLHILGTFFNLFEKIFFYSSMMHFLGTAVIALLAFIIVYALNLTKYVKLSNFMIGFFTLMFAFGIGSLWEIGEFTMDKTLGTHNQGDMLDPLEDTMYDLIWDGIAGFVIAFFGTSIVKYPEIIHPFEEYLKKLRNKKNKVK